MGYPALIICCPHDLIYWFVWFRFDLASFHFCFYAVHVLVGLVFYWLFLLQMAIKYSSIYRMQAIALILAATFPILANVIYILRLGPYPFRNFTPLAFMITGLLTGMSIFRFHMLDLLPVARDKLLASIKDAIIVLDHRDHVVEVNQVAQRIFGIDLDFSIGKPIDSVFVDWPQMGCIRNWETQGMSQSLIRRPLV